MKENKLIMRVLAVIIAAIFVVSMGAEAKNTKAANKAAAQHRGSVAEIEIPEVPEVTPIRENGVVSAEEWASYYPAVYASFVADAENVGSAEGRVAYTEANPNIKILYQGMAFSKDYTEAVSHAYTLEDIAKTERPHKLANCLTCKTADFTALVNELGKDAYKLTFDEVFGNMSENVSCYNCHGNEPGTINIMSDYMAEGFGDDIEAKNVDAIDVSCAQCHIEYYFDPETKATCIPYTSREDFTPDAILAFYNEMGFKDYTNENTGVNQIKVQHPEFETVLGEGSVHGDTYTCADCHMGVAYDEKGDAYVNHKFTSPLDNEILIKESCATCHNDLATLVKDIQAEVTEKENQVSDLLVELNQKLAAAITAGTLSEEDLATIRQLDRDAQFYWDFCYVENSEGAHNSAMADYLLNKASTLANQALDML